MARQIFLRLLYLLNSNFSLEHQVLLKGMKNLSRKHFIFFHFPAKILRHARAYVGPELKPPQWLVHIQNQLQLDTHELILSDILLQ